MSLSLSPHFAVWFSAMCVAVLASLSASITFADGERGAGSHKTAATMPSPKPDLSPHSVTKLVVEALQKNDANDFGVKVAWKFASPGNQQATGPLEHFIPMVKSPAYLPLVGSQASDVRELAKDEESAAELVIVTDSNGEKAFYIFQLSKQADGDVKDCWMTDGVIRVEPRKLPPVDPPKQQKKMRDGEFPV